MKSRHGVVFLPLEDVGNVTCRATDSNNGEFSFLNPVLILEGFLNIVAYGFDSLRVIVGFVLKEVALEGDSAKGEAVVVFDLFVFKVGNLTRTTADINGDSI